jgi:hypothetical protein
MLSQSVLWVLVEVITGDVPVGVWSLTPTMTRGSTDDQRHDDLRDVMDKAPDTDLLREMIGFAAECRMEPEVGAVTGAAKRYRDRDWETRAGTVEYPSWSRTILLPVTPCAWPGVCNYDDATHDGGAGLLLFSPGFQELRSRCP